MFKLKDSFKNTKAKFETVSSWGYQYGLSSCLKPMLQDENCKKIWDAAEKMGIEDAKKMLREAGYID